MFFFSSNNFKKYCGNLFLLSLLASCTGQQGTRGQGIVDIAEVAETPVGSEVPSERDTNVDVEVADEVAAPVEVQGSELGNLKLGLLDDPFYNKLLNYLSPIEVTYPLDNCPTLFPMATTGCAIYEFKGHLEKLKHHTKNLFGNGGYFSDNPVEIEEGFNKIFKTGNQYSDSPEFVRITSLENISVDDTASEDALHVAVEFFFKDKTGQCRRDTVYEYVSQGACPTSEQCDAFVHVLLAKEGERTTSSGATVPVTHLFRASLDSQKNRFSTEMGDMPGTDVAPTDILMEIDLNEKTEDGKDLIKLMNMYRYGSGDRSSLTAMKLFGGLTAGSKLAAREASINPLSWEAGASGSDALKVFKTGSDQVTDSALGDRLDDLKFQRRKVSADAPLEFFQGEYLFADFEHIKWPDLMTVSCRCLQKELDDEIPCTP